MYGRYLKKFACTIFTKCLANWLRWTRSVLTTVHTSRLACFTLNSLGILFLRGNSSSKTQSACKLYQKSKYWVPLLLKVQDEINYVEGLRYQYLTMRRLDSSATENDSALIIRANGISRCEYNTDRKWSPGSGSANLENGSLSRMLINIRSSNKLPSSHLKIADKTILKWKLLTVHRFSNSNLLRSFLPFYWCL